MKTSIKQVIESDNWILTAIHNGLRSYRIDAKRRFHLPDTSDFFSSWGSKKYVERLIMEKYGKKPSEMNSFKY